MPFVSNGDAWNPIPKFVSDEFAGFEPAFSIAVEVSRSSNAGRRSAASMGGSGV